MKKLLLASLLLVAATGVYMRPGNERSAAEAGKIGAGQPAIAVQTVEVRLQPMPVIIEAVGTVEAGHSVAVRTQVDGVLEAVLFREGEPVRKGQLLFRIDDRGLRAALDQAQASLARDQAQLREAQAQRERLKPLAERGFITSQEYAQAQASAEALSATVQADRAQLEAARVRLDYSAIHAPISGRTGSLAVRAGNLVSAATALVVISSTQPVQVAFNVPQRHLSEIRHRIRSAEMPVAVRREQDHAGVAHGKLVFIDNTVSPETGTVLLKAEVPNLNEALWPGEFVFVRLTLKVEPEAVVVPVAAVQPGQDGAFVYVVEEARARLRPIKVAREVEGLAVVGEGLSGGEQVITELPGDLAPGRAVTIVDRSRS